MNYSFPYQKIMDLKINEKNQAQWMFQTALHHLHSEEEQLADLLEIRKQTVEQMNRLADSGMVISEVLWFQSYIEYLDTLIKRRTNLITQAEVNVIECREGLVGKQQQEKIWDKLKEKRVRKHLVELHREEQKQMDEFNTIRHHRPRG